MGDSICMSKGYLWVKYERRQRSNESELGIRKDELAQLGRQTFSDREFSGRVAFSASKKPTALSYLLLSVTRLFILGADFVPRLL